MTDLQRFPERTQPDVDPSWIEICPIDRVPIDRGIAAMVGDAPVAVFRLSPTELDGAEEFAAVSHLDPASGSPVMARGLVGSSGTPPVQIPTVASPLHKQRYNLRTGVCLDDDSLHLQVFDVSVTNGTLWVRARSV